MIYYFAYGSNMSLNRMNERGCKINSSNRGILQDHKLVFNKKSGKFRNTGFANVIPNPGTDVEGALYEIDDSDILKLDKWEGSPNHYKRIVKNILTEVGIKEAYVYIASSEWISEGLKPSKSYIKYLLDGKLYLTQSYFNYLRNIETTTQ